MSERAERLELEKVEHRLAVQLGYARTKDDVEYVGNMVIQLRQSHLWKPLVAAEAERDALQKRVQDSCERGLRELVKLNNYALQHRNGIDVSWVVKVIEEVRACFEAALKGEAK